MSTAETNTQDANSDSSQRQLSLLAPAEAPMSGAVSVAVSSARSSVVEPQMLDAKAGVNPASATDGVAENLAPMMKHYLEVKRSYPDFLLLFQVGDFYEIFFDDARTVSDVLSIRLTTRDKNDPDPIPMCGVPIHAIDNHLTKLLDAGHSVVLVSQVEDAKQKKGMVRREITRVLTPGIRFAGDGLDEKRFNFLAAVILGERGSGVGNGAIVYTDVSTGVFRYQELEVLSDLLEAIDRIRPAEILLPTLLDGVVQQQNSGWCRAVRGLAKQLGAHVVQRPFSRAPRKQIIERLQERSSIAVLTQAPQLERILPETSAAIDALLSYVADVSFGGKLTISRFGVDAPQEVLFIDASTQRNLELLATGPLADRRLSVISRLDRTRTAMGARLFSQWLLAPSRDLAEIDSRHRAVAELMADEARLSLIGAQLLGIRDLERLTTRVVCRRATPYDLRVLADSLAQGAAALATLSAAQSSRLRKLCQETDCATDVQQRLDSALTTEPPSRLGEEGIFKAGFHQEIDRLRDIRLRGKQLFLELETRERERSGISSLRVKFNSVFGYFIEISKTHLAKVPDNYERRQTLVNAERYITPELKELEQSVLSAKDRELELERALFDELRSWVGEQSGRIQLLAARLSELDVLAAFARLAREGHFVCPRMTEQPQLIVRGARHPVIEEIIGAHNFIANDIVLDGGEDHFAVLTGPNMGGKSTYLRQIGIIQLLAQAGSFVPADAAEVGLVDRIFTRIGASDDITKGDSTFMVEMREASSILNRATSRSLVLIDEIGRGTATADGLAIARAIAESLIERIRCRTVFATHFHELTSLAKIYPGVCCISVGVEEHEGEVTFTHKILHKAADKSYGIDVARLAGLPEELIRRARELLEAQVEERSALLPPRQARADREVEQAVPKVIVTPIPAELETLRRELSALSLDSLAPIEALNELYRLKQLLSQ